MSLESEIKGLREELVALTKAVRWSALKELPVTPPEEPLSTIPAAPSVASHPPLGEAAEVLHEAPVASPRKAGPTYDDMKNAFLAHARTAGTPVARAWLESHGWKTLRDAPEREYDTLLTELSA